MSTAAYQNDRLTRRSAQQQQHQQLGPNAVNAAVAQPFLYYMPSSHPPPPPSGHLGGGGTTATTNNGELDKSDEQIYESIYDTRWRLMNQVGKSFQSHT